MFLVLCPVLQKLRIGCPKKFLQLNDKAEIVIITPSGPSTSSINNLSSSLGALSDNVKEDLVLSFDAQVTKAVQSCFVQLRHLAVIRSFLSSSDLKKVIHAFISSGLDHCSALYSCRQNIQRLQLIQNAAARLLSTSYQSLLPFTGYL